MPDLGDLTNFMKEGGLSDLDWLDVNEEDYRKLDRLPKQNLDVVPELQAHWQHRDESSLNFVPNTDGPRTMADMSQLHGQIRDVNPEDLLVRTARMAIMASVNPQRFRRALESRFDRQTLQGSRTALASVLAERGLLGRFYVDAADFPDCHKGGRQGSDFVRRFAAEAPFVKAKEKCQGCVHQHASAGANHCGVFHKEIVVDVPYTEELAEKVEQSQRAHGKVASTNGGSPKERIRAAFLAQGSDTSASFTGRQQRHQDPLPPLDNVQERLIDISNLTKKRDAADQYKVAEQKAAPIVAMIRRELLKGRVASEVSKAVRLAFDIQDLRESREFWEPLYKQAGLYGAVYSTQDSFSDCREGSDFLARHGSSVRAIVSGDKCNGCIFNKVGRCLMYGRKLVASIGDTLTDETVAAVLDEHSMAGRLPVEARKMSWGDSPAEALQALHTAAMSPQPARASGGTRGLVESAFRGHAQQAGTSDLTKRSILKSAQQYMNEGLYGDDLMAVMRSRFDGRDLLASASELRGVLAEQGLQGIKYVDPAVYDDYGIGCKEAQRKHRSRSAVRYAKVGDKCASCVHQTRPGFCSVLDKQLVVEPPYIDKLAEQKAVLASGKSTEVSYADLMNNGLSMMQEYELQHRESAVEVSDEPSSLDAIVEFGSQGVRL